MYRVPPDISKASRLTRLGKIAEATALIRRFLGSSKHSNGDVSHSMSHGDKSSAEREPESARHKAAGAPQSRPRSGLRETIQSLEEIAKSSGFNRAFSPRPVAEPIPSGASFTTAAYSNAAGNRNYKLYVPSHRTIGPVPLIVMLHGCTQSPDDFAAGTRMNALAEEYGFLVAYPAQHSSANAQHCWNWFNPADQRRGEGEPSLIAGITEQIIRDHPVDPERVYIAGLSAGGAAAAIMAEAYPDLYAAAGVHSGLPSGAASDLPSALDVMRTGAAVKIRSAKAVPAIIFHGDKDSIVHPHNGEAVAAQTVEAAAGVRQTIERGQATEGHSYSRTIYADAKGRTVCEHWKIHGAGHAWAGGSLTGSYTDPHGPDASREMVRFFFEHRRTLQ